MRLKSKLPMLILLVLVAATVVGFIAANKAFYSDNRPLLAQDPDSVYFYSSRWQVHWGESTDSPSEWEPFDAGAREQMKDYKGFLQLRRTLPELSSRDPYLFLMGFKQLEVFLDGRPLYSFNMDGSRERLQAIMPIHPVRLQPEDSGKTVEIRLYWNHAYLTQGWNGIGTRYQLLLNGFSGEWPLLVYAALFTSAGLFAAVLFLRRRQESIYIWFSLLSLSAGVGIAGKMTLWQFLFEVNAFYYWKDLLLGVGIYAFIGFYGEALRLGRSLVYRVMKGVLLAYLLFTAWAAWWNGLLFWRLMVDWLPYCSVPILIVVSYTLIRQSRENSTMETIWLMRGYVVLLGTGLIYMALNMSPALIQTLMSLSSHMLQIIYHELPAGLLLFMLCLAMVVFHRFMEVYRQAERNTAELAAKNEELERFQSSLEQLVRLRTQELEEANRSLASTMRDKAETLAEVSVLEERNRIAHEIHDVVGHTLTAAIVQLEASKKLAGRDVTKAVEKLDIINGLVRKGLDDIRRSVRLLKDEGEPFDLHAALDELIHDTEQSMAVSIVAHIERFDASLGWLTQRVLYHALQEGLTNGIRHGNSRRFTFLLTQEGDWIRFVLDNDGAPFGSSKLGFGLTAMMERVQLLGGTVSIGEAGQGGQAGPAAGCRLELTLPIAAAAEADLGA